MFLFRCWLDLMLFKLVLIDVDMCDTCDEYPLIFNTDRSTYIGGRGGAFKIRGKGLGGLQESGFHSAPQYSRFNSILQSTLEPHLLDGLLFIHIYIYIYMCVYIHMHMHISRMEISYIYIYIYMYIYVCVRVHIHVCVDPLNTTHTHTITHAPAGTRCFFSSPAAHGALCVKIVEGP